MNTNELITRDPLHREHGKLARLSNFPDGHSISSYLHSGRINFEVGGFFITPKYFMKSLNFALVKGGTKNCWILVWYFFQKITDGINGKHQRPKSYIRIGKEKGLIRGLQQELFISSTQGYYDAIQILLDRRIIYIREERLFINWWPLTWNIENNFFEEKIREVVEKEIERVKNKIRVKEGRNNE